MAGGTAEDEREIPAAPERRRQSPPRPRRAQETASPPIPEELLLDIFRRIHDPDDLVRAAAACASFLRLITDSSFLRQYRELHAPPLLGFLHKGAFHPAVAPHPSAAAARAVALAADFSFSFLPAPARDWVVQDIRDARVLLGRINFGIMETVVCDPLHRQYHLLPPIPGDMCRGFSIARHIFLVPPPEEEAAEETAFRVIWMARRGDELVALVFSSTTGQWQAGPSHSWSYSLAELLNLPLPEGVVTFSRPQYAYGCFYWVIGHNQELLVLDIRRMEFTIADVPPEAKHPVYMHIAIVEAGEGRPGMFVLPNVGTPDLSLIIRRNDGGSSGQWKLEKTISLGLQYTFAGSMGRRLFLAHNKACFSLDSKTFQLQRVTDHRLLCPRAYSNFPPLLSSPTVATGVEIGTERRLWNKVVLQAQA